MRATRSSSLAVGAILAIFCSSVFAAEITLFEGDNFQGRRVVIRGDTENLDNTGFNDQTSSIIVRDGTWQVCVDAFYRGGCMQLRPGEYPRLDDRFTRGISSLRLVGDSPNAGRYEEPRRDNESPRYAQPENDRETQRRQGRARAVLFEGSGFTGRSFPIEGEVVNNFAVTGFNDRASSLRVEKGYWIFCSDANFAGDCRTFGPGEYPELPFDLDQRISSGRRITERYPYTGRPEWNRR